MVLQTQSHCKWGRCRRTSVTNSNEKKKRKKEINYVTVLANRAKKKTKTKMSLLCDTISAGRRGLLVIQRRPYNITPTVAGHRTARTFCRPPPPVFLSASDRHTHYASAHLRPFCSAYRYRCIG